MEVAVHPDFPVSAELKILRYGPQHQQLVPPPVIQVGKPQHSRDAHQPRLMFRGRGGVRTGALKIPGVPLKSLSQPNLVRLDEREDLFAGQGVLIPDDEELLVCLHDPGQKFPE